LEGGRSEARGRRHRWFLIGSIFLSFNAFLGFHAGSKPWRDQRRRSTRRQFDTGQFDTG